MSTESKGLDVVIGLVLAFFVAEPLRALMIAGTMSQLWDWFIASRYGAGPSLGVWYGFSLIASILFLKIRMPKEGEEDDSMIVKVIVDILMVGLAVLGTLGGGWLVKVMLDW